MAGYPYYPQQPMMNNAYGQIQPYQDRLAQLQSNYQQTMPYGQMQMQQAMQQIPQSLLCTGYGLRNKNQNEVRNQSSYKCNWWSVQDVRKPSL